MSWRCNCRRTNEDDWAVCWYCGMSKPVESPKDVATVPPVEPDCQAPSKREREAVCLLYLMYRHFHEGDYGGVISWATTDQEVLELVHSWMANEGLDPYTNGGPKAIQGLARQCNEGATTSYWGMRWDEIEVAARLKDDGVTGDE